MKRTKVKTIILLVLACLVLLVTGTYAAYTNVESAKRVLIAGSTAREMRFSSNILSDYTDGAFPYKPISVGTSNSASIGLTICNYPQNNITKVSEDTITYTLTFKLVDENGAEATDTSLLGTLSIQDLSSGSDAYIPLSEKATYDGKVLTGNTASLHLYTIRCDDVTKISSYSLRIQAAATDPSLPKSLAADLKLTSSDTLKTEWTGDLVKEVNDPKSLDAFNYRIHGSTAGTMTLSWGNDVSISPWFKEELQKDLDSDAAITTKDNSISFPVGRPGQPTSYHIQFYRKNGITEGWPEITPSFTPTP